MTKSMGQATGSGQAELRDVTNPRARRARVYAVSFGLMDSGCASLSTFVMGVVALRSLGVDQIALYGSMFSAFVLCSLLPTQLVYVPSQLAAAVSSVTSESSIAPSVLLELRRNIRWVFVAAVGACVLGVPLAPSAGWTVFGYACAGLFALVLVSPLQSHARAALHVCRRHGAAAIVSIVTLVAEVCLFAGVSEVGLSRQDPCALAIIFVITAFANVVGVLFAVWALRSTVAAEPVQLAASTRIGFLIGEGAGQAAGYVAVLLVAALLGAKAVAELESARVVASPVQVLLAGLLATLIPAGVRFLVRGNIVGFSRVRRIMMMLGVLAGGLYLGACAAGVESVSRLVGRPVQLPLVGARAGVMVVEAQSAIPSSALMSSYKLRQTNTAAVLAALCQIVLGPFALLGLGLIGMPAAQAAGAVVRLILVSRYARRLFVTA